LIAIVMGVTGTGKTTIGRLLAARTGWAFAEGDDYHSEANKAKMHAGIPLTDADRAPWLASLHQLLHGWFAQGQSGILACSALKQSYRDVLIEGIARQAYEFVLLSVSHDVLAARLRARTGHYMNPALLDSQFATLEVPSDALSVSAEGPPEETVCAILQHLGR
jgi:gluconokinase